MDTFERASQAVEQLKLRAQRDPLRARIEISFEAHPEPYAVFLDAEATRVRLLASRMGGTGGPDGEFDPMLAAAVANLAYDLDIHLGVDRRDGEIEARRLIDLAHVPQRARVTAITWALRRFLADQALARRCLRDASTTALLQRVLADPNVRVSA